MASNHASVQLYIDKQILLCTWTKYNCKRNITITKPVPTYFGLCSYKLIKRYNKICPNYTNYTKPFIHQNNQVTTFNTCKIL